MKGKRYTTEDKIRILRDADRGEGTIQAISIKRHPETVMKAGYSRYGGSGKPYDLIQVKQTGRDTPDFAVSAKSPPSLHEF